MNPIRGIFIFMLALGAAGVLLSTAWRRGRSRAMRVAFSWLALTVVLNVVPWIIPIGPIRDLVAPAAMLSAIIAMWASIRWRQQLRSPRAEK
jgi:hypothetical protein